MFSRSHIYIYFPAVYGFKHPRLMLKKNLALTLQRISGVEGDWNIQVVVTPEVTVQGRRPFPRGCPSSTSQLDDL
jgi:hypothetical protein